MDEKMISDLRMKSGAHWKKIVEKYGSGEKGTVLDFKDFLQGRQAASVTLHGCSHLFQPQTEHMSPMRT